MKLNKKFAAAAVVAVIAVGAVAVKSISGGEEKLAVNAATAEKKNIEELLAVKAPLEGTESIEVVSRLHYEIMSVFVEEGDKVEKGQVIAQLDTSKLEDEIEKLEDELELLKIQQKENTSKYSSDIALAQARLKENLEQQQRDYETALDELETARRDYNSSKALFDAGAQSETDFKAAKNKLAEAERKAAGFNAKNGIVTADETQLEEIENIKAGSLLESSAKSIEIAEKELERKKEELDECQIKSSIDGTVIRVNAKVGRFADEVGDSDNLPMFEVENIENLKMNVKVSEYSISKISVGQKADIKADILKGGAAEGVISRISPTGEEKSGTNERFIPIQIDIKGNKKGLIAGINATADIHVATAENAIVVPIETIYDNGGDTYSVFKINDDGTVSSVPVELGVESVFETEIKGDIAEGDRIVLNPTPDLSDGMSVIVNE